MLNCTYCKHAKWMKKAAGKLHPSGDGACSYPYSVPALPASMYWTGLFLPTPSGGYINRRQDLTRHCPYFAREEHDI
jgi:hypothetical protein